MFKSTVLCGAFYSESEVQTVKSTANVAVYTGLGSSREVSMWYRVQSRLQGTDSNLQIQIQVLYIYLCVRKAEALDGRDAGKVAEA